MSFLEFNIIQRIVYCGVCSGPIVAIWAVAFVTDIVALKSVRTM